MADRTAVRRVRQYRAVQKNEREIVRVDLQIPARAVDDLKAIARTMRDRYAENRIRPDARSISCWAPSMRPAPVTLTPRDWFIA